MKFFVLISMLAFSYVARAQEGAIQEKPLPAATAQKADGPPTSDDDLFERHSDAYRELQPSKSQAAAAPAAPRAPANAVVPMRYVDREMGVVCYYLAPADSTLINNNSTAAINCVKLEDPEEKAMRQQQYKEREQDRQNKENAEEQKADRQSYQENEKALNQMRKKSK